LIFKKNGARGLRMDEPLVLGETHPIQWSESKVDLTELAKLRWIEGQSCGVLGERYGKSVVAIRNYCQAIRKKDFDLPGLTKEERKQIKWAYRN